MNFVSGIGFSVQSRPADYYVVARPQADANQRYGACDGYDAPSHASEPVAEGDGPRTFVEWFTWIWGEDHRDYRERIAWEKSQAQPMKQQNTAGASTCQVQLPKPQN